MKKIYILFLLLAIIQSCASNLYHRGKELEEVKVSIFDYKKIELLKNQKVYGKLVPKKELLNKKIPIKPIKIDNTDNILIFDNSCPFYVNNNKILEIIPYINFNGNEYINISGLHGFWFNSCYIKINYPGKKYSLITLSEDIYKIKSVIGQPHGGDLGITNSIIDAGGKYKDKNGSIFKIFVINESKLAKNFIYNFNGYHLKKNILKKILKKNNIEKDVKNIKVEEIVEIFNKINAQ